MSAWQHAVTDDVVLTFVSLFAIVAIVEFAFVVSFQMEENEWQ